MRKFIALFPFLLALYLPSFTQHTLTSFPSDLQLYPRDLATDTAEVLVQGSLNAGHTYDIIQVDWYRDMVYVSSLYQSVTPGVGTPFVFSPEIAAELHNYSFYLIAKQSGNPDTLATADSVVAGDAYIIQGQSNAESARYDGSVNAAVPASRRAFIRTFASATGKKDTLLDNLRWFIGDGDTVGLASTTIFQHTGQGNIGQWCMKMADQIVVNQGIPVAIMNGAYSGSTVAYHNRKNSGDPADPAYFEDPWPQTNGYGIYGRLLYRVQQAGLTGGIRAIFWALGETDAGGGTTNANYKYYFDKVYQGWETDYAGFERLYILQTRWAGCSGTAGQALEIQEAQVEIVNELNASYLAGDPAVNAPAALMVTKGLPSHTDNCHYPYSGGYEVLGTWAYNLIARDLYGEVPTVSVDAPKLASAELTSSTRVTLTMETTDALYAESGAKDYFVAIMSDGSTATPVNLSISGNQIFLDFSTSIANISTLALYDVMAGPGVTGPYVKNNSGMGMVSFEVSDFSAPFPVEWLGFEAKLTLNGVGLEWETASEFNRDYFEVERSYDTLDWQTIGIVQATGSQNRMSHYEFKDGEIPAGKTYYRIREVDFDGHYSFSEVLEVSLFEGEENSWQIFPNPTTGRISLVPRFDMTQRARRIVVQDMRGATVMEENNPEWSSNHYSLDLHELPAGIYIVRVASESGVFINRISKE